MHARHYGDTVSNKAGVYFFMQLLVALSAYISQLGWGDPRSMNKVVSSVEGFSQLGFLVALEGSHAVRNCAYGNKIAMRLV